MRTTRRAGWVLVGSLATLGSSLAECSGGNEVADVSVVPPAATAAPAVTAPDDPDDPDVTAEVVATTSDADTASTAAPATTAAASTTADPDDDDGAPGGPMFSDALGVPVDTAPGVSTPGDTRRLLPEGLYVHIAWTADPNDPSVFTVQPDDVEILEAYANVSLAYYRAALTTLTTDDPLFDRYMIDGGAQYDRNFEEARTGGYVGSLGNGVVLRPYVLIDQTTADSATVLDCYLQNEQYVPLGQTPELDQLKPKGTIATLVRSEDGWKVDTIASEPAACL